MANTITKIEDITSEMFDIQMNDDLDFGISSALNSISTFASSFHQEMATDGIDATELADRKALMKYDKLKGSPEERTVASITAGQKMWISDTLFREFIEAQNYAHLQALVFLDTVNMSIKDDAGVYKRVYVVDSEARSLRNQLQRFKTTLLKKYVTEYQASKKA